MPKLLPEKFHLNGVKPEDLSVGDKLKYDKRVDEEARRKDVNQIGQEALDFYYELEAEGRSSSDCFTDPIFGGYSLRALKAALAEEARIKQELVRKPSAEVESTILKVADVKIKYSIDEFVVVEPEVIE